VYAEARGLAVEAVADGALLRVDVGSCGEGVFVSFDGRVLNLFKLDAGLEGDAGGEIFEWQGFVRDGDGHAAVLEEAERGEGHEDDSDEDAEKDAAHGVSSPDGLMVVLDLFFESAGGEKA